MKMSGEDPFGPFTARMTFRPSLCRRVFSNGPVRADLEDKEREETGH